MKNNRLLKEVRQFQKIAGILKEDDNIDEAKAGKELFDKVLNSSSFIAFMDDGDWNYTRFGFGDVDGKCYMVEMESGYEDDRDLTELKSGLTANMVVKAGVKKGFFEVGYFNFYSEDRESEMVNWLEGLYASKPGMQAEEKRLNYKDKPNFGFEPEDKKIRGTWILDNEGESVYLIKKCSSYANFLARVEDRMSKDPDFAAAYKYFSENVEYFAEPLIDNEEYGDFDDIFGEDFTEMSQAEPDDILTFDEWANDITAVWKRDFNG